MGALTSKITSQGQISIPPEIREALGVGPGSTVEWTNENGQVTVKRSGRFSLEDLHKAAFPEGPPKRRSLKQLKEDRARYIRERHARD